MPKKLNIGFVVPAPKTVGVLFISADSALLCNLRYLVIS